MKVEHASYGGNRLVAIVSGDNGTRLQIDVVGQMAFMFKRVFEIGADIEIDATDTTLQFRQRPKPQPKAEKPSNFKRSLNKEV